MSGATSGAHCQQWTTIRGATSYMLHAFPSNLPRFEFSFSFWVSSSSAWFDQIYAQIPLLIFLTSLKLRFFCFSFNQTTLLDQIWYSTPCCRRSKAAWNDFRTQVTRVKNAPWMDPIRAWQLGKPGGVPVAWNVQKRIFNEDIFLDKFMLCINKWAGQGRQLVTRGREPCRSPSFQFNSTCSYQVKGDKDVQLCKRACKCRFVCKVKFSNCGGLRGLGGLAGDIAQWGQGLLSGSEPDCKCPACCLISCQLLINMISASSRMSSVGSGALVRSSVSCSQPGFLIPLFVFTW